MKTFAFLPLLTLAAPASAQLLFAIDSSRAISTIDIPTGAKTPFGTASSNAATTGGLAYDAATRTLYLTSTSNDSLYTLDLTTGTATLIGAYGDPAVVMHGLEWDSSAGTLFGVSSHNNGLYNLNTTTGLATLIGTSGLTSFSNLGYNSTTNVMYATNSGADSFYQVDRATGAVTLIGPLLGPTNPNGLAYDSDTGRMLLVDNSTDSFYSIDMATGAATLIGPNGAGNLLGLAYIPAAGTVARIQHACGQTSITVSGEPQIGGTVTTTLGGIVGAPIVGLGFTVVSFPFCTCTLGHDWGLTFLSSTLAVRVPYLPSVIGLRFGVQGADFLGVGGCPAPQLTLTDTMVVTIG